MIGGEEGAETHDTYLNFILAANEEATIPTAGTRPKCPQTNGDLKH